MTPMNAEQQTKAAAARAKMTGKVTGVITRSKMAGTVTDYHIEGAEAREGAAAPEGAAASEQAPAKRAAAPSWRTASCRSSSNTGNDAAHGSSIENGEQQNEYAGAYVAEMDGMSEPDGVEMSQHTPTST
jgi:hypothetical protein